MLEELNLSRKEMIDYLNGLDKNIVEMAKHQRIKDSGRSVYIRAVIDISNICVCDCLFCGNSLKSTQKNKYRLSLEEVYSAVDDARQLGIDVIHLASGENRAISYNEYVKIIEYIQANNMICELAIGVIPDYALKCFKKAGLERIILKFETSNEFLYQKYKKCHRTIHDVYQYLKHLKNMGFKVGTGNIVGFKEQTTEDLINDLILLNDVNADMRSTSCLQPNSDSNFTDYGDQELTSRYLSLIRLTSTNRKLCIPTNSTLGREGKINALILGANEISVNFTPVKYKGIYSIYSGADRHRADYYESLEIIKAAGMKLSTYRKMKEKGYVS